MNRRLAIASVLLVLVAAVACSGRDDEVLAEVEGRPILADDFREEYVRYLASTGLPDEPRRRSAFLERLISMRLVQLDAEAHGLADSEAFELAGERVRRRLLIDALLHAVAFDTVTVSETELEDMFVRVNTEVTARHLYSESRDEALVLVDRLASGETFEELAREVFADPGLAESGGSLGAFGFDEMDPAFEQAAFTLPVGAISEPVRTSQGWSVIRVDDRAVRPLITETEFAARRPQLAAYIIERERVEARRRLMTDILAACAPEWVDRTVERMLSALEPGVANAESPEPDTASELVRYNRDGRPVSWTVGDFLDAALYTDPDQRRAIRDRSTLEAFVSGLIVRDVMMHRSRSAGLDRSDRYRDAVQRAVDDWLYEQGYERIAASEDLPEDTLRAYFEQNADDFITPERVELREIVVESLGVADSLRAALATAPFADLARRHSIRGASADVGGDLGFLSRTDLGPLADRVFDAPQGAVVGPIPVPGAYLLLEVGDRQPARPSEFDEARDDIDAIVRRDHRARLVRDHAARLRDQYTVRYSDVDLAALPLQPEPVVSS